VTFGPFFFFGLSHAQRAWCVELVVRHVCVALNAQAFGIANTDNLETPRPAVVMGISGTYPRLISCTAPAVGWSDLKTTLTTAWRSVRPYPNLPPDSPCSTHYTPVRAKPYALVAALAHHVGASQKRRHFGTGA